MSLINILINKSQTSVTNHKHAAALTQSGKILHVTRCQPGIHAEADIIKWCEKGGQQIK